MASIDWPDDLPGIRLSGYSGVSNPRVLRTQMESGRPRVALLSSSRMDNLNCSILIDDIQAESFREFFDNTTKSGVDWFDVRLDTGLGVALHEARFVGGYRYVIASIRPTGQRWYIYSFRLEVSERREP